MSLNGWEDVSVKEPHPCHIFLFYSITFLNQISINEIPAGGNAQDCNGCNGWDSWNRISTISIHVTLSLHNIPIE